MPSASSQPEVSTEISNGDKASSGEISDHHLQDVSGGHEFHGWEKLPPPNHPKTWDLIRRTADPR